MNLKNILSFLTVLLMSLFLLCGCTAKDEQTVIKFASWGSKSEIEILQPLLANFEKENPDIKVEFMHIPQNYFQKIHLLFASNTSPDVIFINNLYLPVYANAGVLEPLQISDSDFFPQALEALTFKGQLYAIPRDVSNLVIYYNKDMFDKKHIPYPSDNWTFEDFLITSQKLTDNSAFGISFEEDPLFYLPYLMSNGGGILPEEIKTEKSQKSLDFYANLRKKYHTAPKKNESASATMAQMFLQKRLGMYLSGRWMVPKIREEADFNWDIAKFPNGTKGSIVPLDASGWAVAKSSKHKQEAKKLIKYLSSSNAIKEFTKSGLIVPARQSVANSEVFLDRQKPENRIIFLEIISTSKPTPVTVNYREILDNLKTEMEPRFN